MKLGIGSDHAGFAYKGKLIALLRKKGYEVVDFGTDSPASVDYPDIAVRYGQRNGPDAEQASGHPGRPGLEQ